MRLHWRELRAIRGAEPSARAHHRARQADVRRQSGEHRRPAAVAGRSCRGGTSATSRCWSVSCPVTTPSSTSPRNRTTIIPSPIRNRSSARTWKARCGCWRPPGNTTCVSTTSAPARTCGTGPGTTGDTRSTHPNCAPNWAGRRCTPTSPADCATSSIGMRNTATGGRRPRKATEARYRAQGQ